MSAAPRHIGVAVVSTYPPRRCGIAAFSSSLIRAITAADPGIAVSSVAVEASAVSHTESETFLIVQGDPSSYQQAAENLNDASVRLVHVQHEFGLYGIRGPNYEDHLEPFLLTLRKPLITTLHTVLPEPSSAIRAAMQRILDKSIRIIVMTHSARRLLVGSYTVSPNVVRLIPHGVPSVPLEAQQQSRRRLGLHGRRVVLTLGFLHPRKGLEEMIRAMRQVAAACPKAVYVIVGTARPDLARSGGVPYREQLSRMVQECGVEHHVCFVDEYVDDLQLLQYLLSSDVVVTPYPFPHQVTSGVLSLALAAGRAIVSTRYNHAVEALGGRRGVLVRKYDHNCLADAVVRILQDDELRCALETRARRYARGQTWAKVGKATAQLYREIA